MHSLIGLLLISAASMICWEMLRYITPVEIPVRAAPFAVLAICCMWTGILHLTIIFAFAGCTGVALFNRLTGAEGIQPWTMPKFQVLGLKGKNKRRKIKYLPELPPDIGRRIPRPNKEV